MRKQQQALLGGGGVLTVTNISTLLPVSIRIGWVYYIGYTKNGRCSQQTSLWALGAALLGPAIAQYCHSVQGCMWSSTCRYEMLTSHEAHFLNNTQIRFTTGSTTLVAL